MRSFGIGILAALALALGTGCKKSTPPGEQSQGTNQPSTLNPQPSTTLARIHWLGKDHIVAQRSSAYLSNIWSMAEARQLETRTLDKLALAIVGDRAEEAALSSSTNEQAGAIANVQSPIANRKPAGTNQLPPTATSNANVVNRKSQIVNGNAGTNQAAAIANVQPPIANGKPAATNQSPLAGTATIGNWQSEIKNPQARLLRPLLEDLLRNESYLEIRRLPNQLAEVALAVHLDAGQASLWTSNLTAALASATTVKAAPAAPGAQAWVLPRGRRPSHLSLSRAGDWTLLGLAGEKNGLLDDFAARIQRSQTPVPPPEAGSEMRMNPVTRKLEPAPAGAGATNEWVNFDIDLPRVSSALDLGWHLPENWPRISASWTGQRDHVRTAGKLSFAKPLDLPLEAWNIPTNLIHEPLVSFTALRGIRNWLSGQKWIERLKIDPVPNQFCSWAESAIPVMTFAATPISNSGALLQRIGPRIAADANDWMTTNAMGEIEYSNRPPSLNWLGIPMFTPEVQAITTPGGDFLLGRLGPPPPASGKPVPPQLFDQLTARPNLLYYDWEITGVKVQHWIYLGQTARLALVLPQMTPSDPGYDFLMRVAPKLSNSGTEVVKENPRTLSYVRNSQLGCTAIELHFLADWLDSPAFPKGLHTLLAPRPVRKYLHPPKNHAVPHPAVRTNAVARPK